MPLLCTSLLDVMTDVTQVLKGLHALDNPHNSSGVQINGGPYTKLGIHFFKNHTDSATDDMGTIPRHEIINPMPGGQGQMIGIGLEGLVSAAEWRRNQPAARASTYWNHFQRRERHDTL